MGNSTSSSNIYKYECENAHDPDLLKQFTVDELQNLELNKMYKLNNSCFKDEYDKDKIDELLYDKHNLSDEFEFGKRDTEDCNVCLSNEPNYIPNNPCVNLNCDGATKGTRIYIKRKNSDEGFKANKLDCCLSGNKIIDGKTCRDDYLNIKNINCTNELYNYCSKNNNLPKKECRLFCNINPERCDTIIAKYCENNPNDQKCDCIRDYENQENQSCHVPSCQRKDVFKTSTMLNENCTICENVTNEVEKIESKNIPISIILGVVAIVLFILYIILSKIVLKNFPFKVFIIIGIILLLGGINIYFTVNDYREISDKFFCSIKK